MKYKYFLYEKLVAESDSEIKFNLDLFPSFDKLKVKKGEIVKKKNKTALDKINPEEE